MGACLSARLPINAPGRALSHVELSLRVGRLANEKMTVAVGANGGGAGAGRPHAERGMGRVPRANKLEGRGRATGGRAWEGGSSSRRYLPAGEEAVACACGLGVSARGWAETSGDRCAPLRSGVSSPGRC